MKTPSHLNSTFELIKRAYPISIPENEYLPLLYLLSEYLSDKNIADLMDYLEISKTGSTLNDVYLARQISPDCSKVKTRLSAVGLSDWIAEGD